MAHVVKPLAARVDSPYTYDVYLAFALQDFTQVRELQIGLEKRGILCYPRYDIADANKAVQSSIQEGIRCSKKCLIFFSDAYVEDDWYTMETQKVLNKVERISREVLIIVDDCKWSTVPRHFSDGRNFSWPSDHETRDSFLNELQKDISREPNPVLATMPKQNIGYGSALGYFYGFLHLVLPDFRNRLEQETLAGEESMLKNTVKKMLIILPESCFCAPAFVEAGKIEHTDKYVVRVAHRAGNKNRDYKSSLYRIFDKDKNEEYYFVGELATPLLTMYESYHYNLTGMSRDELYEERDAFFIALKAILSHPDNSACNNQFKLLFWASDPAMRRQPTVGLYDFLLPEIRKELDAETEPALNEQKRSSLERDSVNPVHNGDHSSALIETFVKVDVSGPNPGEVYDDSQLGHYKMTSRPRGQCLVINIANFDKGDAQLQPRRGAAADTGKLVQLFGKLGFEVQVHNDLTYQTLEKLLLTTSNIDHSNYDAFACCFLTHGKLGELYTSDAKPIRILDIVEFFTEKHCPSLRGKPKMFFIQACLRGSEGNHAERTNGNEYVDGDSASVDFVTRAVLETEGCADDSSKSLETDSLDWDANVAPTLLTANDPDRTWAEHRAALVPSTPDFLMSYATLPGAVAYRDTEVGSLYVGALVARLSQKLEMDRALKYVTKDVRQQIHQHNHQDNMSRFQLPFHLTTGMDKLLRL